MPVEQDWKWKPQFATEYFDLQRYAFNIASFGGRMRMSNRRGSNIPVQYRDGTIWTPKDYEQNEFELAMWVVGADPDDGSIPDDPSDQFWENVDALRRIFRTDTAVGELAKMHPTQAKEVVAEAEIADALDFESMAGATRAAFIVRFILPGVWFRDPVAVGETDYTSRADTAVWPVTVDSDVIVKDPKIWLRDPGGGGPANVKITNNTWGDSDHWIQFSDVLAAGEEIEIDVGKWRATLNGTTRVTGNVDWSGQPQFFWLLPGENELELEVTSGPVDVKVEAKGAYW